jgi:hypothetical protein
LIFVLLAGGYIFVWNSKLKEKAAARTKFRYKVDRVKSGSY